MLLLTLIALVRVRIVVAWRGDFFIFLRVLFLSFRMNAPGAGDDKEKTEEKTDIRAFLQSFHSLGGYLRKTLKAVFHRLRVDSYDINISVCGEDAAQTAMRYAEICAAVYPLAGWLENTKGSKRRSIRIRPDFQADQTRIRFEGSVSMRVGSIVALAVTKGVPLLFAFAKNKPAPGRKGSAENE